VTLLCPVCGAEAKGVVTKIEHEWLVEDGAATVVWRLDYFFAEPCRDALSVEQYRALLESAWLTE
jgi:hypothetical protein